MQKRLSFVLIFAFFFAVGQQQPAEQQPTTTVILPSQVTSSPPPPPVTPISTTPPTPPPPPPPSAECLPLDQFIKQHYDAFFVLTRLIDTYTLNNEPPNAPPLNSSYAPLTILAPTSKSVIDFLMKNKVNVRELATDPLRSVLLAPTLGAHFARGYYPAESLPSTRVILRDMPMCLCCTSCISFINLLVSCSFAC